MGSTILTISTPLKQAQVRPKLMGQTMDLGILVISKKETLRRAPHRHQKRLRQ